MRLPEGALGDRRLLPGPSYSVNGFVSRTQHPGQGIGQKRPSSREFKRRKAKKLTHGNGPVRSGTSFGSSGFGFVWDFGVRFSAFFQPATSLIVIPVQHQYVALAR
jgi:hypothetical protein